MNRYILLVLLIASVYTEKVWILEQTSDAGYNTLIENTQRVISLTVGEKRGSVSLAGTCNRCEVSKEGGMCTEMFCEDWMMLESDIVSTVEHGDNIQKLEGCEDKDFVMWKIEWVPKSSEKKKFNLRVTWLRFRLQ